MTKHSHKINTISTMLIVFASTLSTAVSAENNAQKLVKPKVQPALSPKKDKASRKQKNSASEQAAMEVIEVVGRRPTPISSQSTGSYTLNQQLIEDYQFGNGNLNDILGLLPGVQYSEESYSAEQASNIRPAEVSLSGSDGYQSGYFINGMNNNSRLSTGNASLDKNLLQDVSGHSQASFINLQLLEEIEVYDSNVPAKYGQFSGGVVSVTTKQATDAPSWSLSYRQTSDSFVTYNQFYAPDFSGEETIYQPSFSKQDMSASFSTPIGENAGLLGQLQMLQSSETKLQLGVLKPQKQTNYNGLIKYHHDISANDELEVTAIYAPYQGQYFDTYALNSNFDIDGGSQSILLDWSNSNPWADIETSLSWHQSLNRKTAPSYWFNWVNLKGKDWGSYDGSQASAEGGYGSIDKTQQNITLKQDYLLNEQSFSWGETQTSFGGEIKQQTTEFDRLVDAVLYNGAVVNPNVDCAGYTLDCVETVSAKPISELERDLGRPLNLTNLDDLLLYQNNVLQTGQYFQSRQVSPKASTKVDLWAAALYAEQTFNWKSLNATLGLRYDYNDFIQQHNIAPRFRAAYDLFDSGNSVLVLGINRYYEADLSHHKLNEAVQPSYKEVRRAYQNQPQQWQREVSSNGYRTVYQDTTTPFSDELTLAFRQSLFGGTLEAKWLARNSQDQINRVKGVNSFGEPILFAENSGRSEYQRYSLSWMASFASQHVEFNISHVKNETDKASFDGETIVRDAQRNEKLNFNYDESELVYLQQIVPDPDKPGQTKAINDLITQHDLDLAKQDYNRPFVANLSWGGGWGNWRLSAYARYSSKQDVAFATGKYLSLRQSTSICEGCVTSRTEYPLYIKGEQPAFWLLSGSIKYDLEIAKNHRLTFSFDGENLTNSRTYQVNPYATGTELGRRFWLGVAYQH